MNAIRFAFRNFGKFPDISVGFISCPCDRTSKTFSVTLASGNWKGRSQNLHEAFGTFKIYSCQVITCHDISIEVGSQKIMFYKYFCHHTLSNLILKSLCGIFRMALILHVCSCACESGLCVTPNVDCMYCFVYFMFPRNVRAKLIVACILEFMRFCVGQSAVDRNHFSEADSPSARTWIVLLF